MLQVHKIRTNMEKVAPVVIEPELDQKIQRIELLVGKYDNALLIDTDFMDSYQFLPMKRQVYIDIYATEGGGEATRMNLEFRGIHKLAILKLMNLPLFGTMGATMQCTKFLLRRV